MKVTIKIALALKEVIFEADTEDIKTPTLEAILESYKKLIKEVTDY